MTRPVRKSFNERAAMNLQGIAIRDLQRRIFAEKFIPVVFDGLGSELVPGVWGDVPVHFDGVILRWRLLTLEPGDLQVDVWKTDYAGFPPTVADTITGSDVPNVSGSDKNESVALTGWTTTVSAGDTLRFNIDSVSGITKATLTLTLQA
jgi:hypothetical protein